MALALAAKTHGGSTTSATSRNTASVTPTAGGELLVAWVARSADLATVGSETPTISGVSATWAQVGATKTYDASTRMMFSVWRGTGGSGSGALTIGTSGGTRSFDRWAWMVIESTGQSVPGVVQSSSPFSTGTTGGSPTLVTVGTLAGFGSANNLGTVFIFTDVDIKDFTEDAGYTSLIDANGSGSTGAARACYYKANTSTVKVTVPATTEWVGAGLEVGGAALGGGGDRGAGRGILRGVLRGTV